MFTNIDSNTKHKCHLIGASIFMSKFDWQSIRVNRFGIDTV